MVLSIFNITALKPLTTHLLFFITLLVSHHNDVELQISGAITMSESIDELTVRYEDNGVETVKELDKKVLTKGAWSTIVFKYQSWDAKKQDYSDDKYTIRRYQKRDGVYQLKSKFNISSRDQATQLIDILSEWVAP